jgi:hypothetical protein
MLNVTDAAMSFMAEELDRTDNAARVIRMYHNTEGLHLRLSEVHPGDRSFATGERTIFVVDADLAERLIGRTLDVKAGFLGRKLSFTGQHPGDSGDSARTGMTGD